jgi:hypothetical protein
VLEAGWCAYMYLRDDETWTRKQRRGMVEERMSESSGVGVAYLIVTNDLG